MDMPASSSAPELSPQQQFWRAKRKQRFRRLPQNMAVSTGLFLFLAAVQGQFNAFGSWTNVGAESSPGREMGYWRTDASLGLSSSSFTAGRRLSVDTATGITTYNLSEYSGVVCAPAPNSSSVLPSFPDLESNKATATIFFGIITLYMFLGLAIVCDSFFECSLSAICESLKLKDDVAGATFMAAGGSAPELMTSVMGVFLSRSDVGFGTIVGSAVFNVLFVIGACAFVAPNLKLTWWPLARDASYYCFSLAMIVIFVTDLEIHVVEAALLLLFYVGYIVVMYYNERLEAFVTRQIAKDENPGPTQKVLQKIVDHPVFALFLYGVILTNAIMVILEVIDFNDKTSKLPCVCGVSVDAWKLQIERSPLEWINYFFNWFFVCEMIIKFFAYGFFGYWKKPLNCFDGSLVFLIIVELILVESAKSTVQRLADSSASIENLDHNDTIGVGVARLLRLLKFVRFVRILRVGRLAKGFSSTVTPTATEEPAAIADAESGKTTSTEKPDAEKPAAAEEGAEEEEDDDDDGPFSPFEVWGDFSTPGGIFGRTMWFVGLPLSVTFWLTIPDCRRPMFEKFWFVTFSNCIIWIGLLSIIMVWMVERLGEMYGVPSSIMGIFVLAAGTSIPDCLSSVAVARRGHGDMAVSSSIGSNIFDVLLGLPLPWFIYTAILRPAVGPELGPQWVPVNSDTLAVMILTLFVMVALVVTSIHISGWILSVRLGMCMMTLYFVFLAVALLLDQGVIFGPCTSNV